MDTVSVCLLRTTRCQRRGRRGLRMTVVLIKLFDDLFESSKVGLAELNEILQVEDEDSKVASPVSRPGMKKLSITRLPILSAVLVLIADQALPLLQFSRAEVRSPLFGIQQEDC